jgi:hypothetical protein
MLQLTVFFVIIYKATLAFAASNSTCGSLITYRQHAVLLNSAPQCFRNGCGSKDPVKAVDSSCASDAPCSQLWNLMKTQFDKNWCASCPHDTACRIHGWPILNATSACELKPDDWLFYVDGNCCIDGNEPFEIADWIGMFCNASEWRSHFAFYGGMAKEDWEEWIEPWNWTVRLENFTTSNSRDRPVRPVECRRASLYLGIFASENLAVLVLSVIFAFARWQYVRWRENQAEYKLMSENVQITRANIRAGRGIIRIVVDKILNPRSQVTPIITGLGWCALEVGINFGNAAIIHKYPGYEHVPLGDLGLLFCSRPSVAWVVCFAGFLSTSSFDSDYGSGVWADIAWTGALREFVMQVLAAISLLRTVITGSHRDFYLIHRIRPFWRGHDAHRMYIGALLWTIGIAVILVFWLYASMLFYTLTLFHRMLLRLNDERRRLLAKLRNEQLPEGPQDSMYHQIVPKRVRNWIRRWVLNNKKNPVGYYLYIKRQSRLRMRRMAEEGVSPNARWFESHRLPALIFMTLVGIATYITQWLFWDGFVKSMGPR